MSNQHDSDLASPARTGLAVPQTAQITKITSHNLMTPSSSQQRHAERPTTSSAGGQSNVSAGGVLGAFGRTFRLSNTKRRQSSTFRLDNDPTSSEIPSGLHTPTMLSQAHVATIGSEPAIKRIKHDREKYSEKHVAHGDPNAHDHSPTTPQRARLQFTSVNIDGEPTIVGEGGTQQSTARSRLAAAFTWSNIRRKLLLASTGSPSSLEEGRSEGSDVSGNSRVQAYVQTRAKQANDAQQQQDRQAAAHASGKEAPLAKHAHIGGVSEIPPSGCRFGDNDDDDDSWLVDEVVVESEFFDPDTGELINAPVYDPRTGTFVTPRPSSHRGSQSGPSGAHGAGSTSHADRTSASGRGEATNTTAHSETAGSMVKGPTWQAIDGICAIFTGYLIPKCQYFFEPRFGDAEKEDTFRKERWYNTKRAAWFGSVFFLINLILLLSLSTFSSTQERVCYYALLPLFTVPLPVFIALDLPRRAPHFYSIWGSIACNIIGWAGLITMYQCDWFNGGYCSGNRFFNVQFYAAALPFLGLFALGVNRLWIAVGQTVYWGLVCGLCLPMSVPFIRTAIIYLLFSIFVQYLHYIQEKVDRRMYTLRMQLKISYRAQQKAQIAEKRANNSKKRFISYIFHEVRVPLNTAYLAFQNLQAGDSFDRRDDDQMVEVYALESSLQQVQQVLNDVLDLQRMDAGRFESSSSPFNFHRAINALVAGLKVATSAKGIGLDVSLDSRIDSLPQSIDLPSGRAAFVIGDEIRLRQVLTNIASNAVKFTSEGKGGVSVVTKLIWPTENNTPREQLLSAINVEKGKITEIQPSIQDDGAARQQRNSESNGTDNTHLSGSTRWPADEITPTELQQMRQQAMQDAADIDRAGTASTMADGNADLERGDATAASSAAPPPFTRNLTARSVISAAMPAQQDLTQSDHAKLLSPRMSMSAARHNSDSSSSTGGVEQRDCLVVRIEISDSGPGIRPSDMVDFRLFSPYVQTEVGRVQGGKGSGLGLAIVRAIVQLAQGRLGVKSSSNGSTFWMEFRYPFATQAEVLGMLDPPTPMSHGPSELKPVRPRIKPYKDGESSYSAYSETRRAATTASNPATPFAERDRAFSLGAPEPLHRQVTDRLTSGNSAERKLVRESSRQASIGSASNVSAMGATQAAPPGGLDLASPFTSENWTPPGVIDRAILPAMNITAPTPPSIGSTTNLALFRTSSRQRTPEPSPPLHAPPPTATQPPAVPAVTVSPLQGQGRTSLGSTTASSVRLSTGGIPFASPAGEEAFTPSTRTDLRKFSSMSSTPVDERPQTASSGVALAGVAEGDERPSPRSSAAPLPILEQPVAPINPDAGKLKALVVDDDPLTRKLMGRMLTRMGCVVEEAENGQMCLDILLGKNGSEPRCFDIVTLDNAMPVMTGQEAIKVLRAAGRKDFVVGATGNALQSDQNAYKNAGVDEVLCKPLSAKAIKNLLDVAARRRDAGKART